LWEKPLERDPAPFSVVDWAPPVDPLDDDFPVRLTTGRRLDGFNTGVQSGGFRSPIRQGAVIDISPEEGAALGISEGDALSVISRRGSIDVATRFTTGLRKGLVFMAIHSPDDADVNVLTLDAWDPKSGTAEFKATAVRLEPVSGN
jgi:formate dehydrogenase major subunit